MSEYPCIQTELSNKRKQCMHKSVQYDPEKHEIFIIIDKYYKQLSFVSIYTWNALKKCGICIKTFVLCLFLCSQLQLIWLCSIFETFWTIAIISTSGDCRWLLQYHHPCRGRQAAARIQLRRTNVPLQMRSNARTKFLFYFILF